MTLGGSDCEALVTGKCRGVGSQSDWARPRTRARVSQPAEILCRCWVGAPPPQRPRYSPRPRNHDGVPRRKGAGRIPSARLLLYPHAIIRTRLRHNVSEADSFRSGSLPSEYSLLLRRHLQCIFREHTSHSGNYSLGTRYSTCTWWVFTTWLSLYGENLLHFPRFPTGAPHPGWQCPLPHVHLNFLDHYLRILTRFTSFTVYGGPGKD